MSTCDLVGASKHTMNWRAIPIEQLIPQRPPMVMVDCVTRMDGNFCITEFQVTKDCLFLDGELLSTSGIIENMAQSCAARMGAVNMQRSEAIKIGYIGEIRNCEILSLPEEGDLLTTEVTIEADIFYFTLAHVEVKVGEKIIARSRMKIALVSND